MMLEIRKAVDVIRLGTCRWWIMILGRAFDGPISQKPLIIKKIWPRVRRCQPDVTSLSGAALFSLACHKADSGTRR